MADPAKNVVPHQFDPNRRLGLTVYSLALTREQIENNPDVDFSTTLPWQLEKDLCEYFRWPDYWHSSIYHFPEYSKISPHDGDIGHLADIMLNEFTPDQS